MKNFLPLSYIELSSKNLIHNIKQFRNLVKRGTRISVAIKGNAYGHGQNEIAKILEPYVDYFQINSKEELELLRKSSKKAVLLFGYVQKKDLAQVIKLGCILAVFSIKHLKEIDKAAQRLNVKQTIHISVDAYLGREGVLVDELPKFLKEIKKCKFIKMTGIYAHFANIEDTSDFSHAQKQIREYQEALKLTDAFGFKNLQTHISATSGILIYEKETGKNSLVRLGIGVYGLWPSERLGLLYRNKMELKPVLSWKTKVAQIKVLPKGRTIGYGLTYKTRKKTKIAIIPVGYADGLDRGLSNKGEVLISGARCKIIGRISMNMFTVDVSNLPKVEIEDEVIILGSQGKEQITAEKMAKQIDTINYEITARISPILPRIIV
ncbi:alanine racemase [Candidatus Nomurabacteria bacterium RIFCSPLOWO2_01_FULL_40_18]|uniref:Alanine racemase n=1 Tax=Candidatus Nomurabacteria bacterium RIFCSPLOWO2_01_FULL_40_18 TaxID=1801773 RepID=A0A1F6XK47_9BACT|nr:MAG: alanine racemase [Candidatus Nomurabacteria bacterium RIFCSPLOWO2_01_FULL_40_18]